MPRVVPPDVRARYLGLRQKGFIMTHAAREVGVSMSWARGVERSLRNSSGDAWLEARREEKLDGPVPLLELRDEARRALEDFEFFRFRYMGHVSTPWQVEAASEIRGALATPDREFIVMNVAPGLGKSTLLVDIGAWLTCHDRSLRGLFMSRAYSLSERNTMRLRRYLERTSPVRARPEDVERGLAVDASATLSGDFGRFRPAAGGDVWRKGEYVVEQVGGGPIEEKEPTWSAFGFDAEWTGNRFTIMFGDDLDSMRSIRSSEVVANNQETFDNELEPRLEPGGVLVVCQQRLGPGDFSRHCLRKMKDPDVAEEGSGDAADVSADEVPKYRHIVYKAHDDTRCDAPGTHRRDAPAWPAGCLLDPHRLPWRDVSAAMKQPARFQVVYQQNDVASDQVLVKEVWVWGGTDPDDGTLCPGVMDVARDLCELPASLAGPLFSVATIDPSPTKMWALQWWVHAPDAANQTFLMDLERRAMPGNELLDWNANEGVHTGWMEEWQARSVELRRPITHWVVEINSANRFLLPYDHVRRWMSKWGVAIVPHTTGLNKLDPTLGPWLLRDKFKFGNIRLPAKQNTRTMCRTKSMKLIDEVTRWPLPGFTDDQVLAAWFLFVKLPNLTVEDRSEDLLWRPSWVRSGG